MTPGRLWWLFQRDFKRGWRASCNAYFLLPQIAQWRSRATVEAQVPVRLLTSAEDYMLAGWALASWTHFTGRNWPIYFHEDGTLSKPQAEWLLKLFPKATIVWRAEADKRMESELVKRPGCRDYRKKHPLALKIFDMAVMSEDLRYIVLDSDVLFFKEPGEILKWVDKDDGGSWFNEDVMEANIVSAGEAEKKLGVKLWPKVNSGICLIQRSVIDLDFCEKCFSETALARGKLWRMEQTLFALCASRRKEGGILPSTYEVTLGPRAREGTVARHYVGAVRDHFYDEGLMRLKGALINK